MPERSLSFSTSGFALSMSAISVFTPVFRLQGRRCIFEIARKLSTSEACVRLMCSSEEGQMRESWCVVQRSAGMCIKQADMRCEHVMSTCEHVISACLDPLAPHSRISFEKSGMLNLTGCSAMPLRGRGCLGSRKRRQKRHGTLDAGKHQLFRLLPLFRAFCFQFVVHLRDSAQDIVAQQHKTFHEHSAQEHSGI